MATSILSSKGQLVIPLDIRNRLGLRAGSRLRFELDDGRVFLTPVAQDEAKLGQDEDGMPVLEAPTGAPKMSPERVKTILAETL